MNIDIDFVKEMIHELRTTSMTQHYAELVKPDDPNCRCALGVACCIEERRGTLAITRWSLRYKLMDVASGIKSNILIPDVVRKKLGPALPSDIVHMNDNERLSFSEIADRLEHYLQEHSCEN